mmetsp:Transcript_43669/g.136613  ORF Transcript_43669/g.136613 Transcript_43669/m.136613 type:complete len:305 (-) Transcript_43669:1017-1931(-)
MQEVEVYVFLVGPSLQHGLELGQHAARRGLRLHKPAVVELHLALREEHPALLAVGEARVGWEEGRETLQDVAQGGVMVVDADSGLISIVGSMLRLHNGLQHRQLHDVVERRKAEKRHDSVGAAWGPWGAASTCHQVLEKLPVHRGRELRALLLRRRAGDGLALHRGAEWDLVPTLIHPVAEAGHAVALQAEHPIHCEQGANRALVLHLSRQPRRGLRLALGRPGVRAREEEGQLREALDAVVEELAEDVFGVPDPLCHLPNPPPVGRLSGHGQGEGHVRRPEILGASSPALGVCARAGSSAAWS